jgi:hypothetical protein
MPQHHILFQASATCTSSSSPYDLEYAVTLVLLEEHPSKSLLHLPIFQLVLHHRRCSHHNKNLLRLVHLRNHRLLIRSAFHRNCVQGGIHHVHGLAIVGSPYQCAVLQRRCLLHSYPLAALEQLAD